MRKQVEKNQRKKKVCNLTNAANLAIIFGPTHANDYKEIKRFLLDLNRNGHKLYVVGFTESKELPSYLEKEKSINIIKSKDLNWLYKPKNEFYKAFSSTNFDILINLDVHNSLPIQYLCASSVAGFKVGAYSTDNQLLDFMININGNSSMKFLIENIQHYLSILNKN